MIDLSIQWEHAIRTRRSVRKFKQQPLTPEHAQALSEFIAQLDLPFDHDFECRFFKADPTKKLYFSMTSPPDNLAFISPTDILSITKVGFLGELILVYANSLGISTCWYGHYHLEELERLMPHLPSRDALRTANMGFGYSKGEEVEGRRAICVTPLGYHDTTGLRLVDRMTETFISYKRRPLADLLINPSALPMVTQPNHPTQPSTNPLIFALDLAHLAPSAANSQHWRFGLSDDQKTITVAMPPGYKHLKWEHPNVDIGICAAHLWLGLQLKGLSPIITLSLEEGRAVWKFKI